MAYFTPEEIQQAKQLDLLTYLTPGCYFCDSVGFKEVPFHPELAVNIAQMPYKPKQKGPER